MNARSHEPAESAPERLRQLLQERPLRDFIANADVERAEDIERPTARNQTYVTSLWYHYGEYTLHECRLLGQPWRTAASSAFRSLRLLFPRRLLEHAAIVDNQPVSTPLYTEKTRFRPLVPGEARRGLTAMPLSPGATHRLPARLVWLRRWDQRPNRDARRDARLDTEGPGKWCPLRAEDAGRVCGLYHQLYLGKYSTLNPRYTERFIGELLERRILTGEGLWLDGRMVAAAAFYQAGQWFTTPGFGYDLALPRELGLYRRLSHRVLRHGAENRLHAHLSAGAAQFKKLRGAYPEIEYTDLCAPRGGVRLGLLAALAGHLLRASLRLGL